MRLAATLLALVLCVSMGPATAVGQSPAVGAPGAPAVDGQSTGIAAQTDGNCAFPVTRTDATGQAVTVSEEPDRVVVLAPSAAQVLWDVGAREKVVGMPVNQYSAYLNGSEERVNVVDQNGEVVPEQVIGAEPDLVLAPNIIANDTVTQLRDAGLTVYKADFGSSISEINAKTQLYGRFVGQCEAAQSVTDDTNESIAEIRTAVDGRDRPRVLYHFFAFTAGSGTFIDEAITVAGGDNVAANAGITGFKEYNPEIVAERDPEWVVVPSDATLPEGSPYENTTAYEEDQTLVVDTNYISQPGPRVVIPIRTMAEAFHPDAFDGTATETTETEQTPTATPEPATPTGTATPVDQGTDPSDGSGPGFGAVAAALALAVGAALLRVRE